MPFKDPEQKRAYNKAYYRKNKEKKQDLAHREQMELNQLLTSLHIGKITKTERLRLDQLQAKYDSEIDSDMTLYGIKDRVLGGSEKKNRSLSDSEPPLYDLFLPEHLRGLPDAVILRIRAGRASPLEYGRDGLNVVEYDLEGNVISKEKKKVDHNHWRF
jgi:hypothetical protein